MLGNLLIRLVGIDQVSSIEDNTAHAETMGDLLGDNLLLPFPLGPLVCQAHTHHS
jgi:hypothetical protein